MDVKSNVRKRREERIRQLTAGDLVGDPPAGSGDSPGGNAGGGHAGIYLPKRPLPGEAEPDPELLWKRGQGRWNDPDPGSPGMGGGPEGKRASFWTMLFFRLVVSALLFIFIWGINRYEPAWSFPIRAFVAQSLTEEMDFSAAEAWYERNFGGPPSFIPIFKHSEDKGLKVGAASGFTVPLSGSLAKSFVLTLGGVEIIPSGDSGVAEQVKSVETGRVLSVTRDALTGMTIVVQHAEGYESVYGHLDQAAVEKGDWVEGGDLLGYLSSRQDADRPTLYFALKKNDRYIDPADVIPFD
ncbi:M23 family metallopeptidase [Paenibacillus sp. M1]|uniref:M23 family metallopeptidase n=1 Tax=Paenibacillus haidiansis TaxID=1574488 RepID=A0ABU7VYN1_9BACL